MTIVVCVRFGRAHRPIPVLPVVPFTVYDFLGVTAVWWFSFTATIATACDQNNAKNNESGDQHRSDVVVQVRLARGYNADELVDRHP